MGKTREKESNITIMLLSALIGGGVALAAVLIFLLLFAAMISGGLFNQTIQTQLVIAACVLGGLTGGVVTSRRWPRRRLIAGLAAGGVCFLILLTVGFLFFDTSDIGGTGFGILAGCLCGGALAGLFPGGKKRKKKRR